MELIITIVVTLIVAIVSLFISGVVTWCVTDMYYKKSLRQQQIGASTEMKTLMKFVKQDADTSQEFLRQSRIETCIEEYRKVGTPVLLIDTYKDLNNEGKADLLDTVLLRVKGRKAKKNKYRLEQQMP